MGTESSVSSFEIKLETAIKGVFESALKDEDEFEISADYETHIRLERLVKGLGLSVFGMSITPSQFSITFEFEQLFRAVLATHKPRFCYIHFDSDGNYDLTITKETLESNWYTTISDPIFFNLNKISSEEIDKVINQMEQVLLANVLSN